MPDFLEILMRAGLTVAVIIALSRLHGLRAFSKMSAFDFAITVSIGSVLASAVTTLETNISTYAFALIALFAVQIAFSQSRLRLPFIKNTIDNAPLLIMENGKLLHHNMRKAEMSEDDVWAKLREANAYDLTKVQAVIMESTGDVSVLHGSSQEISPEVMKDVRRE